MSRMKKGINGMLQHIDVTIKKLTELRLYLMEQAEKEPAVFPFWYAIKILTEEPFTKILPIGSGYEYVMYDPSEGIITKERDYTSYKGKMVIGNRNSNVRLVSLMCCSKWKRVMSDKVEVE